MPREHLTYTNERGESVEFTPMGVYHLSKATGLCDMTNTIFSVCSMGQDGETVVGGRIGSRDVDLQGSIRARDKAQAYEYRRRLCHAMNPQLGATLTYRCGDIVRVIDCIPDNAPVFRRKSILEDFSISLNCPNPFWRDLHETIDDVAAWVGGLEFPAEIPMNTGMELGYRVPSLIVDVHNTGDVKAGMRIDFRAIGTVRGPSLLNIDTHEFIKINMEMMAEDIVRVSTHYGRKHVTLIRGGEESDAFRYLDVDSTYMQLNVGGNLLRYDAEDGLDGLEVTIYHNNFYLGV